MPSYICTTCGVGYAETDAPRETCLICADDRQYVRASGQDWTTLDELRSEHVNEIREARARPARPRQQAADRHRPAGAGDHPARRRRDVGLHAAGHRSGGQDASRPRAASRAIAISHPHFYATMVDWSRALGGVPIFLHEDNRDWVMRPDPAIQFWSGDSKELADGITLVRTGGHFPGIERAALGRRRRRQGRADDRGYHHGRPRHPLGELHVLLSPT